MAVSNANRAAVLLEQCEQAVARDTAARRPLPAPIAVGMAQAYALLALRETLVRDNEIACLALGAEVEHLGDELRHIVRQLETLTDAVRKI